MSSTPGEPGFIPPHRNYQELLSYQKAERDCDTEQEKTALHLLISIATDDVPCHTGNRLSPRSRCDAVTRDQERIWRDLVRGRVVTFLHAAADSLLQCLAIRKHHLLGK